MTDTLQERLRAVTKADCMVMFDDALLTEAADALDAAQAEVERLREALAAIPRRCNWAKRGQWCGGLDCPCKVAQKILGVTP